MKKKVLIIGAGIAGAESACVLSEMGYDVILVEKENEPGGNLKKWDKLFVSKRPAHEVMDYLKENIKKNNIIPLCNTTVKSIKKQNNAFSVKLSDGKEYNADAILITTGFDTFNASVKEEYGYGIYDNVITSVELEKKFASEEKILTSQGKEPSRIGFVHCVGSRDEKVGNTYCSQVCCVTAVKQAISIKEKMPRTEVFCFYMDMRMFGLQYEELYRKSQADYNVNYIRGRLSEACENQDGSILIKVEDTLAGRPLKMKLDLLVLMVGIVPSDGTKEMAELLDISVNDEGFLDIADEHIKTNISNVEGVFLAGTCKGPKTISDTFTDARAVADKISDYLGRIKK